MNSIRQYLNISFPSFVYFILVYCFIFSPRLDFGIIIHTGYLSALLVLICTLTSVKQVLTEPSIYNTIFIFILLAIYHVIMATFYSNAPHYFLMIQISLIVYLIFSYLLSDLMTKSKKSPSFNKYSVIDRLIFFIVLATLLNSTIILLEISFPDVKYFIESVLVNDPGSNINYAEHPFRLRGFSAAGGASLSVVNALSVLLFIYLVLNKQVNMVVGLVCSLVIVVSNVFTGRTGLMFGIIFFSFFVLITVYKSLRTGWNGGIRAVGLILLLILSIKLIFNFDLDPEAAGWAFEGIDELMYGKIESRSVDDLATMLFLPDNPMHILFGVGFFEGDGNVYSRTDSGYLKTLLSIGYPLSIILYSTLVLLFVKLCEVSVKYRWLVLTILAFMFFIEIKEPFLYQNFAARVILLLSGAAIFELNNKRRCLI